MEPRRSFLLDPIIIRSYVVIVLALVGRPPSASAITPEIRATKVGSDVQIDIVTPGSPNYDYVKATHPTLSIRPTFLVLGTSSLSWTDTGAVNDAASLLCYIVSDANKPTLTISYPPNPTTTTAPRVYSEGLQGGVNAVYVFGQPTTLGSGTFTTSPTSTPTIPLADGLNKIYAVAFGGTPGPSAEKSGSPHLLDADGQVAFETTDVTKVPANLGPTFTSEISITPSVSGAVYSFRPTIAVDYQDTDADGIDTSSDFLHVDLNGLDITPRFTTKTATHAEGQLELADTLTKGTSVITITVQDKGTNGPGKDAIGALKSRAFEFYGPQITSITPTAGRPGPTGTGTVLTFTGNGLYLQPGDIITFTGMSGPIVVSSGLASGISETGFQVTIPDNAQTGPVFVTMNGVESNRDQVVQVNYGAGSQYVRGVTVNRHSAISLEPILFADGGTNNKLYQAKINGTPLLLGGDIAEPTSLGNDSSWRTYWGATQTSFAGRIDRYDPGTGTWAIWLSSSKVAGEVDPSTFGLTVRQSGGTISAYLADNANQRMKRVDDTGGGPGVPVIIGTSIPFPAPTGLTLNSAGDTLYFTVANGIKKMPAPNGGGPADVFTIAGTPLGLALVPDGTTDFLAYTRGANSTFHKRISLIDTDVTRTDPLTGKRFRFDLSGARTNIPIAVAWDNNSNDPFFELSEATQVSRYPKPAIAITAVNGTGNPITPFPTKIYADHDFSNDTDAPDTQILILQATLNPTTAFPNGYTNTDYPPRIIWSTEDPDDPSSDATIDSDPGGGDNSNSFDGFTPVHFSQEASYPAIDSVPYPGSKETELINGVSRVRFRYSDRPGDNFIVKATLFFPGFGKYNAATSKPLEAVTPLMTVWKKLHLERDGFANANLYLDPDDKDLDAAYMAPDTSIFADAFRVCYVETVDSGTSQTIPFSEAAAHVDFTNDAALDGLVGSLRQSPSSTGYWDVYLQGAYCTVPKTVTSGQDVIAYQNNDPENCSDSLPPGATMVRFVTGITNTTCAGGVGRQKESLIFNEVIRDRASCSNINANETYFKQVVALHEAGHQFSLPDGTGIMDVNSPQPRPKLDPSAVVKIRDIPYPSCQP